jgi:uncharacterized membrane protein YeaQ/YmgE (transglycosylase-associated protein family)
MELLFVTLIGAAIGIILRYLVPGRHAYGAFLAPAVGGAVAAVVWSGLTWLGWKFDGGWIWVVSLAAGGLGALALELILPRVREQSDARMLHQLSGGRA